MDRQRLWTHLGLFALGTSWLAGCASLPEYAVPTTSLSNHISEPAPARVVRPQMQEGGVTL